MFENAGELCVVKVALFVDGRLAEELIHLLVCEAVAHSGQEFSQMIDPRESLLGNQETGRHYTQHPRKHGIVVVFMHSNLTRALLVKAGEGIPDDVLWVRSIEPLSKHGEEHGEVDGTWCFTHHPFKVFIRGVLT